MKLVYLFDGIREPMYPEHGGICCDDSYMSIEIDYDGIIPTVLRQEVEGGMEYNSRFDKELILRNIS